MFVYFKLDTFHVWQISYQIFTPFPLVTLFFYHAIHKQQFNATSLLNNMAYLAMVNLSMKKGRLIFSKIWAVKILLEFSNAKFHMIQYYDLDFNQIRVTFGKWLIIFYISHLSLIKNKSERNRFERAAKWPKFIFRWRLFGCSELV